MLSHKIISEAEVNLRLAFYLLTNDLVNSDVEVIFSGVQIKILHMSNFPLKEFLNKKERVHTKSGTGWSGKHSIGNHHHIIIQSNPGKGGR